MKAIINNKEYKVKMIDENYDNYNELVEVEIIEGVFASKRAIIKVSDLIKPMKVSMEMYVNKIDKYAKETDLSYDEHRTLDVTITIEGGTKKTRDDLLYGQVESIVNDYGYDFLGCGSDENDSTWEQIVIEYSHGNMTAIKKDLKNMFKEIKKLFK